MVFGVRGIGRKLKRRVTVFCALAGGALGLGGCQTVLTGALTVNDMSNIAGAASTLSTGKGIPEHILSFIVGQDCNISEGLMRADRNVCAMHGAPETKEDFRGVIVWVMGDEDAPKDGGETRVLYAGGVDEAGLPSWASKGTYGSAPLVAESLATTSMTRVLRRGAIRKNTPDTTVLADGSYDEDGPASIRLPRLTNVALPAVTAVPAAAAPIRAVVLNVEEPASAAPTQTTAALKPARPDTFDELARFSIVDIQGSTRTAAASETPVTILVNSEFGDSDD